MKLAMVGGAGFRTPLVYSALLRDHAPGRVSQVALVDPDAGRLATMAAILADQARGATSAPAVSTHTDWAEGLRGADFIFSAMRVSGTEGRVLDERIGMSHGVIGQETVGFGGISYALRTIPVALNLARTIRKVAPDAWTINFTNPAGIVTEAMQTVLGNRVIGICDSPIGLARRALSAIGVDSTRAEISYAGLNHLGWITALRVDGTDRLPDLLENSEAIESFEEGKLFGAEWIRALGALPNEYLHYYNFRRDVLRADQEAGLPRGHYLLRQQGQFWETAGDSSHPYQDWGICRHEREASYMATNRESVGMGERDETDMTSGGYENVALALMRGISYDERAHLILNVPNSGTLSELDDPAIVEVPCTVDRAGAHPIAGAKLPDFGVGLVTTMKYVERQTILAATTGSSTAALRALANHPLIDSVRVARALLDDARASFPELAYLC
ncbi:MAG: 6-phospho-beta-glucosidase [Acidipropionibacterium sp.]|nr:6-phospho-beta-glucosidase [Acidipropionibacterium sp.]